MHAMCMLAKHSPPFPLFTKREALHVGRRGRRAVTQVGRRWGCGPSTGQNGLELRSGVLATLRVVALIIVVIVVTGNGPEGLSVKTVRLALPLLKIKHLASPVLEPPCLIMVRTGWWWRWWWWWWWWRRAAVSRRIQTRGVPRVQLASPRGKQVCAGQASLARQNRRLLRPRKHVVTSIVTARHRRVGIVVVVVSIRMIVRRAVCRAAISLVVCRVACVGVSVCAAICAVIANRAAVCAVIACVAGIVVVRLANTGVACTLVAEVGRKGVVANSRHSRVGDG